MIMSYGRRHWHWGFIALLILNIFAICGQSGETGADKYGLYSTHGDGLNRPIPNCDNLLTAFLSLTIREFAKPPAKNDSVPLTSLSADRCYAESYRVKVFERAYDWTTGNKRRRAYDANQRRYADFA